jgi:hypothetical protein
MFSFLDLPVELRLVVYETLLVVPHDIRFKQHYDHDPNQYEVGRDYKPSLRIARDAYADRKIGNDPHTEILRTCRKIHSEASPILYRMNRFNFERAYCMPFVEIIGPSQANRILHIGLRFPRVYTALDGTVSFHPRGVLEGWHQVREHISASTLEIFLNPDKFNRGRYSVTADHLGPINKAIRGLGGVDRIVLTIECYRVEVPSWLSEDLLATARHLQWEVNRRDYSTSR